MVDRYVRTFAGELSVNTLQLRVAAIAKWHQEFGFPDPTKGKVKRTMKGIRALFNKAPKKAPPHRDRESAQDDRLPGHG
ncbi:hypothetical protein N5K55_03020 (plasmid) [Pseudomonas aeruginosa]|nr:hypothetical protein [Pseudomonas aeruginosa]